MDFLIYSTTHIHILITGETVTFQSLHTPYILPVMTTKRSTSEEDNLVGFWESSEVLPPLLEEDPVLWEAEVPEGF